MMEIPEIMTAKRVRSYGITVFLVLLASALAGCGYKTMPVPPGEIVPKAITDLRHELDERGVSLNWTFPEETVRGDELTDIESFKLFRAVVPADKYCEGCPIPFGEPILVEGGAVSAGSPREGSYKTTLLRPGHLYFFKVRSTSGWWAESADSNVVSFMWDIPPASPKKLDAAVGEGKVLLSWDPVTTNIDGTEIAETVKFQVLKNSGSGIFSPVGELQSGLDYEDKQVEYGRKYQYKVQAVTMYEKGQVGGGVSPVAEAIPVDTTPPPVPSGVQAIRTASGVKIVWEKVQAKDVKGYRVYRRLTQDEKPLQIREVSASTTIIDDTELPESDQWYYSVTSLDSADPANESKQSVEVEVRN